MPLFTFPTFDSHFYDNKTYRGIKLLESLLLELSQEYDYELIICGHLNARVGTLSEIIEADINVPALEEFENVFQTPFVGPRSTCDVSVNTAGRELIDLCKTYGLYILNGRFQPDKDLGNFTHLCTKWVKCYRLWYVYNESYSACYEF